MMMNRVGEDNYPEILAEDVMFFMRSAWSQSPSYVPVFWLGDQLQSWDEFDGLESLFLGALSSGLTGHAVTHSDIGGYTALLQDSLPIDHLGYTRDAELLARWSEAATFSHAIFRTHIGSSLSSSVTQIYDTPFTRQHFARFSKLFSYLADYRINILFPDAHQHGLPMIRPLFMHYPNDQYVWNLTTTFLFGEEMLVTPVVKPKVDIVSVYFPSSPAQQQQIAAATDAWIHLVS
jgi:alpha-glucosidase (family GH31 glycosyl hydrolase)